MCLRACNPAHADSSNGAEHKHMCVAMVPTTTATSKPICCVPMVTVISPRVGGKETRERWDSKEMRQGMGHITTTVALFPVFTGLLFILSPALHFYYNIL